MRLNAINPADNPMEELLYCFGGDDDGGGDSGGDSIDDISADFDNMSDQLDAGETVTSGMSGGVGRGGSSNDNDGDGIPNSIDRTVGVDRSNFGMQGATGDYVSQSISSFQSPSVGVMATPMQAATGRAGFSPSPAPTGVVGSDSRPTTSPAQRGGLYSSALAPSQPTFLQDTALSNLMGGPTTSVNGVPVTRRAPVSIANQRYQPLARDYEQADLDAARAAYGDVRDEAYSDKQFGFDLGPFRGPFGIYEGILDAVVDPEADMANAIANYGFSTIDGVNIGDYFERGRGPANYSPTGLDVVTAGGPLSQGGRVAAYNPANNIVYDTDSFLDHIGGLLTGTRPPDNIQALYDRRNQVAADQREREGGDNDPLFIPSGGAGSGSGSGREGEETSEPTEFPPFKQREYTYTPFTSSFYTIPSRFTQPYGLLG